MSRTSAYARLSRIVIFLFLTFSAAFGQVNGSALVSALTGKTVVPTVELGYTGSVANPVMVNGQPAMFPVKTLVYPDGHEWFRVESGILHADAAQYKTFNRGLEFRIGKVELKGDYLELKLPCVIEPKQSAVVKLMLGSGWQKTMTNEAVLKMADRFLSDPSQHSATVAAKAQPPAQSNRMDQRTGDAVAAFLLLKARAEQGDTEAQLKLWSMYSLGKVPGKTFRNMADELEGQKEGKEWLRKAADGGNARAQYSLGMGYLNSPQDFSEAMKWFRKAADQGNADAPYQLGSMYENGKGVPEDSAEAMKWYHKAADQGNVNATRVIAQAEVRKQAEQGNAKAQYQLGMVYINGKGPGTPPDYVEAMKWFRKAADQGNPDAQFQLGSMCENGSGVPKDYAEAMKWYRKAAVQGNTDAQKYLKSHSEQNAKSTVADVPDPTLPDPKAARAAFSFLERQLTISQNMAGDPEPGLASIQSEKGALCHLRCGFHLASGFGNGGVQDTEIEFALSDINIDTIRYDIDGIGRAIISFGTSDGSPRFSRRDREMDMKQNVLSGWSDWEGTDKGFCRAKPDKDSLERAMRALAYLAKSCGAKQSPF